MRGETGSPDEIGAESYDDGTPPRCGCDKWCGDLAETRDDPRAVCKGLPVNRGFEARR